MRARVWRGLTEEGAVGRTREQHRAIYDAIAARRPDLAHSWATVHIAGVEQWLSDTLGAAGAALAPVLRAGDRSGDRPG